MNSENELDKIFKQKLEGHESRLPDDFWDRIEQEKSDKKKGFIFWSAMAFCLLITFTATLNLFYNNKTALDNKPLLTENTPADHSCKDTVQNALSASSQQGRQAAATHPPEATTEEKINEQYTDNSATTHTPGPENNNTKQTITISLSEQKPAIQKTKNLAHQGSGVELRKQHNNTTVDNDTDRVYTTANDLTSATGKENNSAKGLSGFTTDTNLQSIKTALAMLPVQLKIVTAQTTDEEDKPSIVRTSCPDFLHKRFKIYLEYIFAPEFAIPYLTANHDDYKPYANLRNQSELSNYAFHTGIRVSIVSKRGFAFRTGLVYSQIAERFYYSRPETITEKKWEVIEEIPSLTDPDRINQVWDSVEYIYTGHRELRNYNRYHMIDVPLILGIEKQYHGFSLSANVGAYVNLWFASKARFFSNEGIPKNYSSETLYDKVERDGKAAGLRPMGKGKALKTNIGINLLATIACNYRLSSNAYLIFEPEFRFNLNSFTLASTGLKQQYITPGIIFGLRYKIN